MVPESEPESEPAAAAASPPPSTSSLPPPSVPPLSRAVACPSDSPKLTSTAMLLPRDQIDAITHEHQTLFQHARPKVKLVPGTAVPSANGVVLVTPTAAAATATEAKAATGYSAADPAQAARAAQAAHANDAVSTGRPARREPSAVDHVSGAAADAGVAPTTDETAATSGPVGPATTGGRREADKTPKTAEADSTHPGASASTGVKLSNAAAITERAAMLAPSTAAEREARPPSAAPVADGAVAALGETAPLTEDAASPAQQTALSTAKRPNAVSTFLTAAATPSASATIASSVTSNRKPFEEGATAASKALASASAPEAVSPATGAVTVGTVTADAVASEAVASEAVASDRAASTSAPVALEDVVQKQVKHFLGQLHQDVLTSPLLELLLQQLCAGIDKTLSSAFSSLYETVLKPNMQSMFTQPKSQLAAMSARLDMVVSRLNTAESSQATLLARVSDLKSMMGIVGKQHSVLIDHLEKLAPLSAFRSQLIAVAKQQTKEVSEAQQLLAGQQTEKLMTATADQSRQVKLLLNTVQSHLDKRLAGALSASTAAAAATPSADAEQMMQRRFDDVNKQLKTMMKELRAEIKTLAQTIPSTPSRSPSPSSSDMADQKRLESLRPHFDEQMKELRAEVRALALDKAQAVPAPVPVSVRATTTTTTTTTPEPTPAATGAPTASTFCFGVTPFPSAVVEGSPASDASRRLILTSAVSSHTPPSASGPSAALPPQGYPSIAKASPQGSLNPRASPFTASLPGHDAAPTSFLAAPRPVSTVPFNPASAASCKLTDVDIHFPGSSGDPDALLWWYLTLGTQPLDALLRANPGQQYALVRLLLQHASSVVACGNGLEALFLKTDPLLALGLDLRATVLLFAYAVRQLGVLMSPASTSVSALASASAPPSLSSLSAVEVGYTGWIQVVLSDPRLDPLLSSGPSHITQYNQVRDEAHRALQALVRQIDGPVAPRLAWGMAHLAKHLLARATPAALPLGA
ncbi:hypothetical protein CXG81DRAFT_23584 [Caulochytrium protostelioides]|uniref:Uncharacterized protein n=1 Tax=Caulochytrium protostelioides TaxID=1555241 RepID=A0A4V1IVE2_9FUNG|nr:hypothetical protein CXG81DRAFT_23584 [Caulochytrium protostelioides]|eukprot:RKP03749.1 hypothetical protein CXG81DRAFT_23584 [Caulochytrium protostelioides]